MKKLVLVGFCLFLSNIHYGQSTNGEIVISEERIQSLANKLYELKIKRNKAEKSNTKNLDEELYIRNLSNIIESDTANEDSIRFLIKKMMVSGQFVEDFASAYYTETKTNLKSTSIQNDNVQEILKRLTAIEKQLEQNKLNQDESFVVQQSGSNQKEDVYITNVQDKNASKIIALQKSQSDALTETNAKLDSLLKRLAIPRKDSLKTIKTSEIDKNSMQNQQTIESLKTQLYLLHAKLDRILDDQIEAEAIEKVETASRLSDTVYLDNPKEVDPALEAYEKRKEKYGDYFKQVFFANNSTVVENKYQDLITELVEDLNNEPKIDIAIAGYASKTGNEDYNQQISMQRALALKKRLMQVGISPKRILTDYRGIDYEASSLEQARRLDIELVVRK